MVLGYLLVIISAIGFGFMPIFALYAYEGGIGVPTLLFLRFLLTAIIMFAFIFIRYRGWKVTKKQLFALFLLGGVLYTMQSSFFFSALHYIPPSLNTLLLYLFPIFVAILSFFINKERLSPRIVIAILISLVGIVFVLGSPSGDIQLFGVLLAVGAAITYSFYILLGDRVTANLSPFVTTGFVALFATFSFLIFGVATQSLDFSFAPSTWIFVLCVVVFSTIVSIFTFFTGMKLIGPTKASVLSMIEPVVTAVFSALLLSEQITLIQMVGGSVVLIGATLVFLAKEKRKEKVNAEELIQTDQ